jgi:hypothetical protein
VPFDLRDIFARPWEGDAVVERPPWLRWFPAPHSFRFSTEIANVSGDEWDVIDTVTLPGGSVQRRTMHARQIAPDRVRTTADDMPGGTELRLRDDGFDFTPYVIRTPVLGPLRLPLRYTDSVRLEADGTLVDRIEMRFLGAFVGRITMRLQPAGAQRR